MKTKLLLIVLVLMSHLVVSQTTEIPDEHFERTLVEQGIDTDGLVNGYILNSDVKLVTSLDLHNKKIKDLTGIEVFTSLSYLNCIDLNLSHLDVSKNIGLVNLFTNVNDLTIDIINLNSFVWFD